MNFNHYFTNAELDGILHGWADEFPDLVELSTIGRSHEDRPIWLLTVTNTATGSHDTKPAVWIDANIHATEVAGTTVALHIAHTLLSGYATDAQVTRLLDGATYYIVPRVNPDGAELALADIPTFLRSGTRPYPFPEKQEGIHQTDVDGNGLILQMRMVDPNGDWTVSPIDPRVMVKRGADEQGGTYYRLLPEGVAEAWDGVNIKVAPAHRGLDFNRNFPAEWQPEDSQRGAGDYPGSEPEIRALLDFFTGHPNISAALSYHTQSGVILRPLSSKADEAMETPDLWTYRAIGQRGTDLVGYPNVSIFHGFKYHPKEITVGAFDDWVYDQYGIFGFTVELWDLPGRAGIADRDFIEWMRQHPHEDDIKIFQWLLANAGPDTIFDWQPFDHPQLGPVEIGGINHMYTWRNPPHAFMGEEAARNTPWALALGDMLPKLSVHSLEVTPAGAGAYRIHLVVENGGYLPTFTSVQGQKRKATRPVRVELDLPEGVELVTGKAKTDLGHLEGRSNKVYAMAHFATSPTDNRTDAQWVVTGPAGAEIGVKILSDRAGSMERRVALG